MVTRYRTFLLGFPMLLCMCTQADNTTDAATTVDLVGDDPAQVENVDDILKQYDSPTRDYWQNPDLVIEKIGDLNGKVVADVGVATGYFTFRMAPEAQKIIALDVENRFLQYIEERKFELGDNRITRKIETRLCLHDDPLLKKEEVDVVLMVNTYHFIADRPSYLQKIYDGLKSGGEMVLVDFKLGEMPMGPSESVKVADNVATTEMEKVGFQILEKDTESLQFQYIIKAKK